MKSNTATDLETETAGESAALIPQPHGGALLSGGKLGNRGGPGVVPSVVRDRARRSWYDRIPVLESIADGKPVVAMKGANGEESKTTVSAEPGDRIRALAELSKVGMSGTVTMDDVRERLARQVSVIRTVLPTQQADALILKLGEVWR